MINPKFKRMITSDKKRGKYKIEKEFTVGIHCTGKFLLLINT